MTTSLRKRALPICAVLAFAAALGACSGSGTQQEHSESGPEETPKSSSAGLPAGSADAGEKRANVKSKATGQTCIDCHGADGNNPIDPTYPKLGGQYHDYLAHALQAYRSGDREHALMSQQAKDLTDQEIADLSAYFGSRPSQLQILHSGQ